MAGRRGNDESPLSLFSFQDIITGVTGIMIFILLLLAVNVDKISPPPTQEKKVDRERQQLRQRYTAITEKLKAVRRDYLKIKGQLALYRRCDRDKLQRQITEAEYALAKSKLEIKALDEHIKKLQAKLPGSNARQKARLQRIAELKQRYKELKRRLEERKDFNRVAFVPTNDADGKQPIFVQLSDNEIAVKTFAGQSQVYRWPNNAAGVEQFRHFAGSRDNNLEYFCFLLKPSATKMIYQAPFLMMSQQPFVKPLSKKFEVGLEPLPEDKNAVY